MTAVGVQRGSLLSVERVTKWVSGLADSLLVIMRELTLAGGMVLLFAVDVIAGGLILSVGLAAEPTRESTLFAWGASFGTSAIQIALWAWTVWWRSKGPLIVIPLLIAIAVTIVDTVIDGRLPTYWMFGKEVLMTSSGFAPPDATFMWKVVTALVVLLTACGEGGIVLIRQVMRSERKTAL